MKSGLEMETRELLVTEILFFIRDFFCLPQGTLAGYENGGLQNQNQG